MEPIQIAVVIVVGLALLGALTLVTKQSNKLDTAYYKRRWQHVQKTAKDGNSGQRLAIIDADKLLDHGLKAKRIAGDSMGARLRNAEPVLGSVYQDTWDAHKLRNRLVHEESTLKSNEARFAMKTFHKALKNIGAL